MKELMNEIQDIHEFEQAILRPTSVFVFSADWCPDCRFIEPFIGELIKKYHTYDFFYVDRDACLAVCQEANVMGIPSFVAYSHGKELGRFVSRFRKTREEIDTFLSELKDKEEE